MFRALVASVLAAGLLSAAPGQEKKEQPKKKERIAVADPKEAAKDPDFAIQGEYVGEVRVGAEAAKFGAQVIAKGAGEFDVKIFDGGLPGAGSNGKNVKILTATRSGDKTILKLKGNEVGTILNGTMTLKPTEEAATLKKVERKSDTLGKKPPQGAVVLFAEPGDEKNWTNGKLMELSDGKFLTVAKTGGIKSKEKFGAFKAHVEFRLPWMPNSTGQGRANSGVYLQDRYECQVLDSFGLSGENNECGGIYQQHKPLVNMCLPPLTWQTYDIEFTPAEFDGDKRTRPARATIYHNGVKIHDNVEMKGPTGGGQPETKDPGPFQLQDHGDPLIYRNIWVVHVKQG
jgi:hypothetical protein